MPSTTRLLVALSHAFFALSFSFSFSLSLSGETVLQGFEFDEAAGTDAAQARNDYGRRSLKSAPNVKTDGEGNLVFTVGENYFYNLKLGESLATGVYAFDLTLSDFNMESDGKSPISVRFGLRTVSSEKARDFFQLEFSNQRGSGRVRLHLGEETMDLLDFKETTLPIDAAEFRFVLNLDEDRVNVYWRLRDGDAVQMGSKVGLKLGGQGQSIDFIRIHALTDRERMTKENYVKIDKIRLTRLSD